MILATVLAVVGVLAVVLQSVPELIDDLEMNLVALAPAVILVSSFILSPDASDRVKKFVPMTISAVVTILTFVFTETPLGSSQGALDALTSFITLTAVAVAFYSSFSSIFVGLVGRPLNELTGPGVIGRAKDPA